MYNTIYDCIKMHVFYENNIVFYVNSIDLEEIYCVYVNNIDLEEIFHCKILTHLFNIYFHFFFINGIEFTWIQFTFNQKKVKLIYI